MFFPSSSELINRRFSRKNKKFVEDKKIPISDHVDFVGVTRDFLSEEDLIRKTYGDNIRLSQIYGEAHLRKIYGYDMLVDSKRKGPEPIDFVVGEKLKCGFLSNNGKATHLVRFEKGVPQDKPVYFDSLSGKYLLICCFNLPMHNDGSTAIECRSLIDAYDELSGRYPFEMVVVANLRTDVVYDLEAAFYHFYSAFSCLAIPFSDFETRDYIHSLMRCSIHFDIDSAILVDPQGIILEADEALLQFFNYGSKWAPPFLPTTLGAINKQDYVLRSKFDPMYSSGTFLSKLLPMYPNSAIDEDKDRQQPLSLYGDILLCPPSLTLCRFAAAETDVDEFSTVLDLSRKYVGLYLCIDGEIMEDIKQAHDHCLANNQQLEIVLVPMPFYDEPNSYNEQLHEALRSLKIKSWFLFQCPSVVSRRLWRLFGEGFWSMEKFIIIPPDCESGELCGREVLINFGVDQYPFTRTAILKQRLEYVRSLTPIFSSSLFKNCQMIQNGQEFKSEQLQGKNVLLYLSWTDCDCYSLMKMHYPKIKAMGWEVVFVLLDYTDRNWNQKWVGVETSIVCEKQWPCFNLKEMPWPYMLLSAAAGASIKKLFLPGVDKQTVYLFAVGKDGKIVSRNVEHRLYTHGVTESLFDDVLEADLGRAFATMPSFDGYEY